MKNHFRKGSTNGGPHAPSCGIRGWSPGNSSNKKPKRHTRVPAPLYLSFVSLGLWNVIGLMKCPHQMMENVTNVSIIFDFSLVKPFLIHPENQHSWLEKGPCMKIHFLHNMGIFRPAMLVSGRNYISPSPRQWTTPCKNPGAQKSWRFGKFRWCSFSSIGDFEVNQAFIVIF